MSQDLISRLKFNSDGHVPAVIQDVQSGKVLTLCYMNAPALEKTLQEGFVYVFRRSLNKLMLKGETSGHTQRVRSIHVDCEGKSLLIQIDQKVAGCHKGYFSCYFEAFDAKNGWKIVDTLVFDPDKTYGAEKK